MNSCSVQVLGILFPQGFDLRGQAQASQASQASQALQSSEMKTLVPDSMHWGGSLERSAPSPAQRKARSGPKAPAQSDLPSPQAEVQAGGVA